MKNKPRNARERAIARISKALDRYGCGEHHPEPVIVTMLVDLRHYCDERRTQVTPHLDFKEMNERAGREYQHEVLFTD